MNNYIFLNPDGTQELGLLVVVALKTGVIYAHQCGGLNTIIREIEGFAVPIGNNQYVDKLAHFFYKRFHGYPPISDLNSTSSWEPNVLQELSLLIQEIAFWKTFRDGEGEDQISFLELDHFRLAEITEGWIPVNTVYGSGILIFKNSD